MSTRAFISGMTGSGKSFYLRRCLRSAPRALVVDFTGDMWGKCGTEGDRGGKEKSFLAEDLDDCRRLLRSVPANRQQWRIYAFLDEEDLPALALMLVPRKLASGPSIARAVGGMALYCDELDQMANHSAPKDVKNLWRRGRHVDLDILGGSQTPTSVDPLVRGQSRYLVMFFMHEINSLNYFAESVPSAVMEAHARVGEHGFVIYDQEARRGTLCDKDARVLETIEVQRSEVKVTRGPVPSSSVGALPGV